MRKRYVLITLIILAALIFIPILNYKINVAGHYNLDKLHDNYAELEQKAIKSDEKQFDASDDFRVFADKVRAIRVTDSNLVKAKDYMIKGAEMIANGFATGSDNQIGKGASLLNTADYYLTKFKKKKNNK